MKSSMVDSFGNIWVAETVFVKKNVVGRKKRLNDGRILVDSDECFA